MSVNAHKAQFEASISRLVNGLVAKGFKFVTPEATPQEMHERLAKFDEERTGLTGRLFSFFIGAYDMPDVAKTIAKHVVGFGSQDVDDAELASLLQRMRSCFPLCAITFSKTYGPRFVVIIDGDSCTQSELFAAMDRFQEINLCIMPLGGRLSIKLFGKSIATVNASAATGSLIIVASTTQRASALRQWVSSKALHSDTTLNQLRERFTRWQFWAKALVGMIEYKPHQLRQEVIVLDAETGQPTSTVSPRMAFEFGFVLTDIAGS